MLKIIQVIPTKETLYAIYELYTSASKEYIYSKVDYLALCDDGYIHPISLEYGGFEIADVCENFENLVTVDKLEEYGNLQECES